MTEDDPLPEFNSLFLKILDQEMMGLFSADVTRSLYENLFKFHGVTREQVPLQIDKLQATLRQVFGRGGLVIERHISKGFYKALGIQFDAVTNRSLEDYVKQAKERCVPMPRAKITEAKIRTELPNLNIDT